MKPEDVEGHLFTRRWWRDMIEWVHARGGHVEVDDTTWPTYATLATDKGPQCLGLGDMAGYVQEDGSEPYWTVLRVDADAAV